MKASDVVYYQGKPLDRLTYERLKSLSTLVKSSRYGGEKSAITLLQGIGGARASGGTHTNGGCYDITKYNWRHRERGGRLLGGADWHRPDLPGVWVGHNHGVTAGVGYAAASARRQVTAHRNGRNGLANNGKDTGPRLGCFPLFVAPWTDRGKRGVYYAKKSTGAYDLPRSSSKKLGTVPSGGRFTVIAVVNVEGTLWAINVDGKCTPKANLTMKAPAKKPPTPKPPAAPAPSTKMRARFGTYNVPGPDKYKNATLRARGAAELCKSKDLDAIVFNELEGRKSDGSPSTFARELILAFGGSYALITPTTAYNENYIVYRKAAFNLVEQPGDGKIYAKGIQGRHVTHSILKHRASGKEIYLGGTHLIQNNEPGAQEQAKLVWQAAAKVKGERPAFILGDMNTDKALLGFTHAGLHNARLHCMATNTASMSTYAKWGLTKPLSDPEWIIDQLYAPEGFSIRGYNVVPDLDDSGKFNEPRPADHLLTIMAVLED